MNEMTVGTQTLRDGRMWYRQAHLCLDVLMAVETEHGHAFGQHILRDIRVGAMTTRATVQNRLVWMTSSHFRLLVGMALEADAIPWSN